MRALVASLLLSSSLALACQCPAFDFVPGLDAADVIFEGSVTGEAFETPVGDFFVVRVDRVFKGEVPSHVIAATRAGNCGVFPTPGVPWVFMFHPEARWHGAYELMRCGVLSHPRAELTASELALLGASHPPRSVLTPVLAVLLVLVGAVASAAWRFRGRRRA